MWRFLHRIRREMMLVLINPSRNRHRITYCILIPRIVYIAVAYRVNRTKRICNRSRVRAEYLECYLFCCGIMCKRKLFADFVELEKASSAPSLRTVATLGPERTFYFSTRTALNKIAKKVFRFTADRRIGSDSGCSAPWGARFQLGNRI